MSEMEQWCQWYASQGLTYFPIYGITNGLCRCREGEACGANTGKHPIFKWKGQPSRMPRVTDNVAISTDPLVVIDLDGDVSADVLAEYPPTFTTSTGHGYHLWYRAHPSKHVKTMVGWRPKVDIRAMGGLLIVPPSRHRHGGTYRHVKGDSIQSVPTHLLKEMPEKGEVSRRIGVAVEVKSTETPAVMAPLGAKLVYEMENWEVSRNTTLFRLGCRFFELAHTGLLGQDVLHDLCQAALRSGLTSGEIERTLESARNSV